jgi:hypothetical protein
MYQFRLGSDQFQVELVANGNSSRLPFQVIGPTTEVAFLEELIEESLGSLTLNPRELFEFLDSDPWVKGAFQAPQVVEGDLNAAARTDTSFERQNLGNKLVQAGILEIEELEQVLEDYRAFAETQRFSEFLRLTLHVPPQVLELLLNPALFGEQGFNEKQLGERLVMMSLITIEQLDQVLSLQCSEGGPLGELMAERGFISPTTARFFSLAKINEQGQIDYQSG